MWASQCARHCVPVLHLCHSASNTQHSHSSVQTDLCSSQGENLSASTNHSSGYISPSTHRKRTPNAVGTRALMSRESDASLLSSVMRWKEFLLLRSNPNYTCIPPTPPPRPQVLYNPVKVYNIDLRQTGSSFKKKKPHQIAIVSETQMNSSEDWRGL